MVGLDDASSAIRVKLLAGRVLTTCMADAATFPRTAGLPDASAWPGPCSYFVCANLAWLMQPRGLTDAAAAVNADIAPISNISRVLPLRAADKHPTVPLALPFI